MSTSREVHGDDGHDTATNPVGIVTPFNFYFAHYIRGRQEFNMASYKGCNWEWKMMVLYYLQNSSVNDASNNLKEKSSDANDINAVAQKSPVDLAKRFNKIFNVIASDTNNANSSTDSVGTTHSTKPSAIIDYNILPGGIIAIKTSTSSRVYKQPLNSDGKRKIGRPKRVLVQEAKVQVAGQAATDEVAGQAATDEVAGQAAIDKVAGQAATDEVAGQAALNKVTGQAVIYKVAGQAAVDKVAGQAAIDETAGQAAIDETAGQEVAVEEVPVQGANAPIISDSEDVRALSTNFRHVADMLALSKKKDDEKKEVKSVGGTVEATKSTEAASNADIPDAELVVDTPDNVDSNFCFCGYCSGFVDTVRRKLIEWRRLPDSAKLVYESLAEAENQREVAALSSENNDKKRKLCKVFSTSIFSFFIHLLVASWAFLNRM